MATVFVVDDHEVVRRGIASVLRSHPDLEVVGESATYRDAMSGISASRPDVVVLDVRLPDGNGVDLCREVRQEHPQIRCIILSAYDEDTAVMASVMADASGYLLKSTRADQLVEAVRIVATGGHINKPYFRFSAESRLRAALEDDPRFGALSTRERQILDLIASALTNRQIGERLGIAEKTVKNHVSSLLGKLGIEHRTQAALLAMKRRCVSDERS